MSGHHVAVPGAGVAGLGAHVETLLGLGHRCDRETPVENLGPGLCAGEPQDQVCVLGSPRTRSACGTRARTC